ncbi:MAG: clostripain-related cysteine peptidase [Vulcanimicrobiota bacterium]
MQDFGNGNTADPKNLADFIKWGIEKYPAKNYWLVISDHGDAWTGSLRFAPLSAPRADKVHAPGGHPLRDSPPEPPDPGATPS